MELQCELALKLGVDLGPSYHNRFKAKEFLHAMAECHRQDNRTIIQQSQFISILSDGSTDKSIVEQESVLVRVVHKGEPVTLMADVVPLEHVHADGVLQGIQQALKKVDVTLEGLSSPSNPGPTLVSCNFDGASVMMGCRNDVQAKLKEIAHCDIISVHCVAHRLELAVLDAVKHESSIVNFEQTVKWLYQFYSKFNVKNRRDIKEIASVLQIEFVHLPEIKEVRWLSSKYRADEAVLKDLSAIAVHLEEIATGSTEKANKAKRLHKELTSFKFLKLLHLMLDVLSVVGDLSRFFQTENLLVYEVVTGVDEAVMKLMDLKENGGLHMRKFLQYYDPEHKAFTASGNKTVTLTGLCPDTVDFKDVRTTALLDGIINYISKRFADFTTEPLSCFAIFNYELWPSDVTDLARYGRQELQTLLDFFQKALPDSVLSQAQPEFMTLKATLKSYKSKVSPLEGFRALLTNPPGKLQHIMQVIALMLTISCNTAKCERSFSAMNLVKTRQRLSMGQDVLQDCLLLKTEGPTLSEYNPDRAINHWLTTGGTKHLAGPEWQKIPNPSK